VNDYRAVDDALNSGADPAMLCATCPWDRYCVTPPTMTRAEVEKQIAEAKREDEEEAAASRAAGRDAGMPVGMLLSALALGGRDKTALICPVFALRLRSSGGRQIVDRLKERMQSWDDGAVES
jgi:hypothetical protein